MATKAKAKKKAAPAAKKAAPRKPRKPKTPPVVLGTHPFPPGTEVGFYPTALVGVERSLGREPMPTPFATATVAKDGTLAVIGLGGGSWVAAGPVEDRYRYLQFPVS